MLGYCTNLEILSTIAKVSKYFHLKIVQNGWWLGLRQKIVPLNEQNDQN
jgi:hypothetical protein